MTEIQQLAMQYFRDLTQDNRENSQKGKPLILKPMEQTKFNAWTAEQLSSLITKRRTEQMGSTKEEYMETIGLRIDECRSLIAEVKDPDNEAHLVEALTHAEWTDEGAQALVSLAQQYGAWMLIHAAALAVALDIEDGSLNF